MKIFLAGVFEKRLQRIAVALAKEVALSPTAVESQPLGSDAHDAATMAPDGRLLRQWRQDLRDLLSST